MTQASSIMGLYSTTRLSMAATIDNGILTTNSLMFAKRSASARSISRRTAPRWRPKFGHPLGYPHHNRRRPVWDVAEPPCKISRRSVKSRLRNPLPYKKGTVSLVSRPNAHTMVWRDKKFTTIELKGLLVEVSLFSFTGKIVYCLLLQSLQTFRKRLKTELFQRSYTTASLPWLSIL